MASLEDALLAIEPEIILVELLTTEVMTQLFPSDTGVVHMVRWTNEFDTDLDGTVGGAIAETSRDGEGNSMGPGVVIVFPNADAARERLENYRADPEGDMYDPAARLIPDVVEFEFGSFSGITFGESDRASSLLTVGPVIVGGGGDATLSSDPTLRYQANCMALLDHLRTIVNRLS